MQVTNIHKAKTHFSRLVERAAAGEEIIIGKAGKPVAKLVQYTEVKPVRKPGGWKGKVWMSPDFDKADKEIEKLFYDGPIGPPQKQAPRKARTLNRKLLLRDAR